jgi:predicted metal-dependent hydrolase
VLKVPKTQLEEYTVDYQVRYSDKASKTRIDADIEKGITVVIPKELEEDTSPEGILRNRKRWVKNRVQEFQNFKRAIPNRSYEEGETIEVLGQERTIQISNQHKLEEEIHLDKEKVKETSVKEELEKLLRKEAKSKIQEIIEEYEGNVNSDYQKIYVRDQKTRWGSCSPKDNLSFNWRLILGPEHVIEYVVVHELAHLEERNHSDKFWSKVKEMYPDYKKSNQWLSENSPKLVFEDNFGVEI